VNTQEKRPKALLEKTKRIQDVRLCLYSSSRQNETRKVIILCFGCETTSLISFWDSMKNRNSYHHLFHSLMLKRHYKPRENTCISQDLEYCFLGFGHFETPEKQTLRINRILCKQQPRAVILLIHYQRHPCCGNSTTRRFNQTYELSCVLEPHWEELTEHDINVSKAHKTFPHISFFRSSEAAKESWFEEIQRKFLEKPWSQTQDNVHSTSEVEISFVMYPTILIDRRINLKNENLKMWNSVMYNSVDSNDFFA
jgi:hypothetical protein